MFREVILTDAIPLSTGLARCAREIISRFTNHPDHEVVQAGWHTMGDPHDAPVRIFPIQRGQPDEPERIWRLIGGIRPHHIICIGDPFYFNWLRPLKERCQKQIGLFPYWIGWITIDGDPLQPDQLDCLLPFDYVAPMSQFAKGEIQRAAMLAKNKVVPYDKPKGSEEEIDRVMRGRVLYPGVDPTQFKYTPGTEWNWNGKRISRESHFMAMILDQNTSRKAVSIAIEAYDQFAKGKKDTILYVASDAKDPNGVDLERIRQQCSSKDTIFIRNNSPLRPMSESEVNSVYNVASILYSATSGEGFKLPILEAMSAACLVAMPAYTSPIEILGENRGILIESPKIYWYGTYAYKKRVIPIENIVVALDRGYHLWKNRHGETREEFQLILRRAHDYAADLTWDKTFARVMRILREVQENQQVRLLAI